MIGVLLVSVAVTVIGLTSQKASAIRINVMMNAPMPPFSTQKGFPLPLLLIDIVRQNNDYYLSDQSRLKPQDYLETVRQQPSKISSI